MRGDSDPEYSTISVGGCQLRAATWGEGPPQIIMLHDGLGSLGQWRAVPEMVAAATGQTVLAYERAGHGESLPTPVGPWPADWLHREAELLGDLLQELAIDTPVLVGHSDGGSIALLHAASASAAIKGVLALAPHSWVEQICFDSIVGMRKNRGPIEIGLARHHRDPAAIFEAWSGAWVSDAFRDWDIRPQLHAISVPALIAQGGDDAYATDAQAIETAQAIGSNGAWRIVDEVGHIMHHDAPDAVVALVSEFVAAVGEGAGGR